MLPIDPSIFLSPFGFVPESLAAEIRALLKMPEMVPTPEMVPSPEMVPVQSPMPIGLFQQQYMGILFPPTTIDVAMALQLQTMAQPIVPEPLPTLPPALAPTPVPAPAPTLAPVLAPVLKSPYQKAMLHTQQCPLYIDPRLARKRYLFNPSKKSQVLPQKVHQFNPTASTLFKEYLTWGQGHTKNAAEHKWVHLSAKERDQWYVFADAVKAERAYQKQRRFVIFEKNEHKERDYPISKSN